ncbi:hypothetical protein OG896_24530 [Streptomyces sp. NBC_00669]|uniref:hypothetical protein n=1 Tax=Streptomyces sp. NBC_00669 TaxID=2976011 RepID=UPI002E333D6B|nr:hypothetical protein [Streptomyces sp. NBC_00669]
MIAERDCVGTVQQTGWLNLATGAYTTGVPPAGAGACGDSRSIQTAGVFCDLAPDGTVFGLVVVEYHYDDTGAIESVRLVSAATGATYTLQGTLTVCPGAGGDDGDESPGELLCGRQVVVQQLCDDADGDGVADTAYVELWSVDPGGTSGPVLVGTYRPGDFGTPYVPLAPVDCALVTEDESPGEPERVCAPQIVERCGCDDTDGDGFGDVAYTELWAVDPCTPGAPPVLLGTWQDGDFDQPYTPLAPVDCVSADGDESPGELPAAFEVAPIPLCVVDDATGNVLQNILAEVVYDQATGVRSGVRYVDAVTGGPVPVPGGAHLAVCPPPDSCSNCETLTLCDIDRLPLSTIAGTAASGSLANGVPWTATGSSAFPPSRQSDGAAWWNTALFPNSTTSPVTWTFNRSVNVEFSVVMVWLAAAAAGQNTAQIPVGSIPLQLPSGYSYDAATGIVSIDSTVTGCTQQTPTREAGARFRLSGVTSVTVHYLGTRAIVQECQVFGNYAFGAVDVSLGGEFLRTVCRDCDGAVISTTDTALDGTTPYTPTGEVGVCHPPEVEPCASTVQILRLCDLNPAVEPGDDGLRCSVPFLRHLVHDCTGALVESHDTAMDGTTPYTPVTVTDCGNGGVPALRELIWPQSGIAEDPAGVARQDFVITVTNPENSENAEIRLHASTAAGGACGAYDPAAPVFNNPTVYTYTLDATAQQMSTFRLDLLDFDTFEGVTALSPVPSRVEGDVTWNGSTITANTSNGTCFVYWDAPPATISYRYGNTGGGNACSAVAFQGATLVPDGCCGCTGAGGDGSSAATVELCDTAADGTIVAFLRHITYGSDGTPGTVTDTALDGVTPYVPAGAVGRCAGTSSSSGTPDVCTYTLPDTFTGFDMANAAFPGCWVGVGGATQYAYGDRVTSFEMTAYQSDANTASNIQLDTTATLGAPVDFATFTPPVPAFPTLTAPGYVGTATANGVTITLTDTAGQGLSHVGTTSLLRLNPGATAGAPGTGFRVEFSEPVQMIIKPSGFADPPADNERFCGVTATTAPWDAVKEADGSYTDADTGEPVPDDATVTCVPGTGSGGADIVACDNGGRALLVKLCDTGDESPGEAPCRNTNSTLLCDTSATDLITVFDPANRPDADDWQVISFVSAKPDAQPEGPLPYPAIYGTPYGYPALGARTDQSAGYGGGSWTTYDAAPFRWVIRKTFTAPEDGVAVAQSSGFRGDGGARVRINGVDAGMYGQWNQPATSGTAQIPVTAGENTVEIEVRDVGGINNVVGRLDIALPRTVQFMRHQVTDCATGEVIATTDTDLDGQPYEVTGEVGQCQPVSECCEQPPPETRVDVESDVLCVIGPDGTPTGAQVLVERVYDDQSGDRTAQRLVDPTTGDEVALPDGATLALCADQPTADIEIVTLCDISDDESGTATPFLRHLAYLPGAIAPTVVDTALDGVTPYAPAGTVGLCRPADEPCGDTEVVELCDLVYSPQAPIPTAADTFTLTGNVVLTGGNALWFAQANQDANGIAELTVGGLLPAVMYEFRFESAWVGAGSPDPANNNAVYLLDILDGTSVIATRTRNVSNGSSVSPGAVLTEDLPALAFIAPTSGSVTIRFTDQTTGGGANDRDLLISPIELRTAALTVASTQFLRAMTFDCSGLLTGSQDLAVDGSGTYTVRGVVGTCCGSSDEDGTTVAPGPDTEVLTLCDVAADGTTTGFLRFLTIAADGTVTTADTELDGVTAYTTAGAVHVCTVANEDESPGEPECVQHLREECRWDDTDGDGTGDTRYVEVIAVDGCTGALTTVGTYEPGLTGPYTPVAPVADGPVAGAPAARGVQAHRVMVAPGGTWDASTVPLLQAVTVVARGTATVTTADGASDLVAGESIGWSVARDSDAALTGPLTVTAGDGPVAVAWTASVAL